MRALNNKSHSSSKGKAQGFI